MILSTIILKLMKKSLTFKVNDIEKLKKLLFFFKKR